MERIHCFQERWSIALCACSAETVHFHYGNATLHILVDDLRKLGNALQQLGERLESQKCQGGNGSKGNSSIQ